MEFDELISKFIQKDSEIRDESNLDQLLAEKSQKKDDKRMEKSAPSPTPQSIQ